MKIEHRQGVDLEGRSVKIEVRIPESAEDVAELRRQAARGELDDRFSLADDRDPAEEGAAAKNATRK